MKFPTAALIFGASLLAVGAMAQQYIAKTPISLSSVATSGAYNGTEIVVSVARRDPIIGLNHGAAPTLDRAWLSDGNGQELTQATLQPLKIEPTDNTGAQQFRWLVPKTIPNPPHKVVFHARFVAQGAQPYEFEQDLHAGTDFN